MSSLGGSISCGNRSRSAATVWVVSSTDSVVCDSQATFAGSLTSILAASSGPSTSVMLVGRLARGADDLLVALVADQQDVVVLGGEPAGLIVHLGDQRAGGVDRAQVAFLRPRRAPPAPRRAPRRPRRSLPGSLRSPRRRSRRACSRSLTTCVLCTICLRTYTGAPNRSSACSTVWTARSTPAQYPRGFASRTLLVGLDMSSMVGEALRARLAMPRTATVQAARRPRTVRQQR